MCTHLKARIMVTIPSVSFVVPLCSYLAAVPLCCDAIMYVSLLRLTYSICDDICYQLINKTEVLVVRPHSDLGNSCAVMLDGLPPNHPVCSLGVLLDPHFLLDKQVVALTRSAFSQLQLV